MTISAAKGAIFDVDDTLLDNKPQTPVNGLHERSRLAAFHAVGLKYDLPALATLSPQDNLDGFLTAPVHTLAAAVWNTLYVCGIVDSEVLNPEHPLLREIVALKDELHVDILKREGEPVPGAVQFVRSLADAGPQENLAIASTALRSEIVIFLDKTGLRPLFPGSRIIARDDITHPKPNPEAYNLAFAALGLPESARAHVLAFEDDPRGIMSAKAAGLYTCAITTRFKKEDLLALEVAPDLVAESYAEFERLLA